MIKQFILDVDGRTPKQIDGVLEWGQWMETADRVVQKTHYAEGVQVSTVFLGLDHNFGMEGEPILFETLVFGGELDGEMERYCTWEEAEDGHERMVHRVSASILAQNMEKEKEKENEL